MFELYTDESLPDELFLERLDAFVQKSLADVKAFSERENRPFEEVHRKSYQSSSLLTFLDQKIRGAFA